MIYRRYTHPKKGKRCQRLIWAISGGSHNSEDTETFVISYFSTTGINGIEEINIDNKIALVYDDKGVFRQVNMYSVAKNIIDIDIDIDIDLKYYKYNQQQNWDTGII